MEKQARKKRHSVTLYR